MRSKYFDILLSELSVRCPANEVKWPGSLIEFIAPNYFENIWAMLSPVTPRPTAPRCHLNHCQSLISSLCFRSRVLSEHQSSWLPRWSAMTSSAPAQVNCIFCMFSNIWQIFLQIFFAIYIYSIVLQDYLNFSVLQTCGPWAWSATSCCPATRPSWATTTRRPTTISASKSSIRGVHQF